MRIYVASSWRNELLTEIVQTIRGVGHEVYDFRENAAFDWKQIDPLWEEWTPSEFIGNLSHPLARAGFDRDISALRDADVVVLVLPSGRSSHLELGVAVGMGKPTAVLLQGVERPELSYLAAGALCHDVYSLLVFLQTEAALQRISKETVRALSTLHVPCPLNRPESTGPGRETL